MKRYDLGQNWNGTRTQIAVTDEFIVMQDIEDVSELLEDNERLREEQYRRSLGNGYIQARVPQTVDREWRKEWRAKFKDYMPYMEFKLQKLRSPEFRKFNVSERKI